MENMEITIPYKVSLNKIYSGMHWSTRNEIKDLYHWKVHKALESVKLPQIDEFPINLTMSFTFKSRPLDSSNCAFMGKMIEDALVSNKILPSDTPKHVKSVTYSSIKGKEDKVEIVFHR